MADKPQATGADLLRVRSIAHYGWKPSLPDMRDRVYTPATVKLPTAVDLRPKMPPVYDQGQLGCCTGNAIAGAVQFERMKQSLDDAGNVPSRLMIYYNERVIEGTVSTDAGAMPRDGFKAISKIGVCFEDGANAWPYDISKFRDRPTDAAYGVAASNKALRYHAVSRINVRHCLAAGSPVVIGFVVYDSFESASVARTGVLNMPSPTEEDIGGHCVLVVGYDDSKERYIVRNSWGAAWGMDGYFTMPYDYLGEASLSSDFWAVTLES